ncbi:MAG: DUF1320 family protein [Armatimonadota bacterium]|nr:DUF1320 domain-containing protein [Armatimonadota bacterium]MDW8143961.1 DUF1320 family protein [Armatimonadota bacterium]
MPRYITIDDVRSRLPSNIAEITMSSEPNISQVNGWIDEVEAEVDGILSTRYQTPITATQSLRIVKSICADIVAARVWRMKAAGINDEVQLRYADTLEKGARDRLNQLANGTMSLPDQPESIDSSTPSANLPFEPIIKMDEKQW